MEKSNIKNTYPFSGKEKNGTNQQVQKSYEFSKTFEPYKNTACLTTGSNKFILNSIAGHLSLPNLPIVTPKNLLFFFIALSLRKLARQNCPFQLLPQHTRYTAPDGAGQTPTEGLDFVQFVETPPRVPRGFKRQTETRFWLGETRHR